MNTSWMAKWGPLLAPPDVPGQQVPAQGDEPTPVVPHETDETGVPPADGDETPPAAGDETPPAEGETPPADSTPPAQVERTVPQRRADELVAERWAERRAREAAEARAALAEEQLRQLQALANGEQPPVPGARPAAPRPLNTEDEIKAGVAEAMFTQRCNTVAERGREKHKEEFTQSLSALQTAAGGRLPREFAQVALDVGGEEGAADLITALGKDITKADEILRKTPIQQAVALTAMLGEIRKAPPGRELSKAPAPVKPVVGGGGNRAQNGDTLNSRMSMDEWMAAREKEVEAERKRGARVR